MAAWPVFHVADCHTVLFTKRGSEFVPYQRPEKYPLSKERHRLLKDNAYREQKKSYEKPQCLEPSCIEPWLDHEATLYDLPKPGHLTQQPTERRMNTSDVSMAFPENLDATFHSGLLDTTFNITGAAPQGTNEGDQGIVPDHSDATEMCNEQNESLYDSHTLKNKVVHENEASWKVKHHPVLEAPTQRDLPVLFYPRTCTKPPSKRTIKVPKFSKRSRCK